VLGGLKTPQTLTTAVKDLLNPFAAVESIPETKSLAKSWTNENARSVAREWKSFKGFAPTEENLLEVKVLALRSYVDPKKHYRRNDMKKRPTEFQIGTVVEDATGFYSDRLTRKERKKRLLDDYRDDSAFKRVAKSKFREVQQRQEASRGYRTNHHKKKSKSARK
jgi:hypothetical protein